MYNLYFYYKNYNRYIYFLKYSKGGIKKNHYMNQLKIEKMNWSFTIKDLTDLNCPSILSCLFFFKYYLGILPIISNYKYKFKLNISYYNFLMEYTFVNKLLYAGLLFFINDIYYMINKMHMNCFKYKNYWEYLIHDMNFFLEKKNTLGFFNLNHNLSIKIYFMNKKNLNFPVLETYKIK